MQSLPGDTSVFVELDFCHGGDEKERRGKDGASNWAELVCLVNRLYRSFSIIARVDRDNFEVSNSLQVLQVAICFPTNMWGNV